MYILWWFFKFLFELEGETHYFEIKDFIHINHRENIRAYLFVEENHVTTWLIRYNQR